LLFDIHTNFLGDQNIVISPTKLELSGATKIYDIIISRFQGWGVAFCYYVV